MGHRTNYGTWHYGAADQGALRRESSLPQRDWVLVRYGVRYTVQRTFLYITGYFPRPLRVLSPTLQVYHNMEAPVEDDDIGLRNSQSDEVQLYQSVPEGVHSLDENMLLVDNSEALEVTEQGEV